LALEVMGPLSMMTSAAGPQGGIETVISWQAVHQGFNARFEASADPPSGTRNSD